MVVAPAMGGQLQGKGVGVENFPGVNESTGPNLVHAMQLQVSHKSRYLKSTFAEIVHCCQAARFGAVFEQDLVTEVDIRSRPFTVKTNETTIRSHRSQQQAVLNYAINVQCHRRIVVTRVLKAMTCAE